MTNEQAKAQADGEYKSISLYEDGEPTEKTIYNSIKAMHNTVSLQADGDLISRQAVIDIIEDACPIYGNDYRYILRDKVNELPSVAIPSAEPKTGHWMITSMSDIAYCSNCDKLLDKIPSSIVVGFKYCPNCGAKMGGEQDG